MSITNTEELRKMLLDTIEDVRTNKMEPKHAQAIAHLSGKILQSAKLDLDVIKHNSTTKENLKAGEKVLQLVSK
jgi:hypothetical protein